MNPAKRLLAVACLQLAVVSLAAGAERSLTDLRSAARAGEVLAQFELGYRLASGKGVDRDPAEAAKQYRLAADQGLTVAQVALARSYERGDGLARDSVCATLWYGLAAALGDDEGLTLHDRLATQLTAEQRHEAERMLVSSDVTEKPFIRRPLCPGETMDLSLHKASLADVLPIFERITGLRVNAPADAKGTVTVEVIDAPWETALTRSLQSAGYRWVREGDTLRILSLAPRS